MDRESKIATFGSRLKQARTARGLSQKQLGINAGIDEFAASARINRYELGIHQPEFSIAQALAKACDVSVTFFYAVDDDLADFIFRLGQAKAPERRTALRALNHLDGPPLV